MSADLIVKGNTRLPAWLAIALARRGWRITGSRPARRVIRLLVGAQSSADQMAG